ncbi:MAG: hypothetical protein WAW16_03955, partial [Candidatus Cryosericum sp.]
MVIIYTLLVCSPLFFAYGNFRVHGGDAFSAVVRSLQGMYGIGRSTWFSTEWRETIMHTADGYAQVHLQLEYGRGPVASVIMQDPYPRYRTTVEERNATLHIDVDTNLSQSAFSQLHPTFVSRLVNQFKAPPRVSLIESLRRRMQLLPYHVVSHTWVPLPLALPGFDMIGVGGQCFLIAIAECSGIPVLALLVLVPFWLALPVFWLWVLLSVLYVVLPPRIWDW